jgi:exodeoxyribonuclease-3
LERLIDHARALKKVGVPVVLAGDLNVVPTEFDIYPKHSYGADALLQPQPRAAFKRLLRQGWTDAVRTTHREDENSPTGAICEIAGRVMQGSGLISCC